MKRTILTVGFVLILTLAAGCNRYDAKPQGAGASGRPLEILHKPQIDMERFFKYDASQEKVIELMHRPFDALVKPGPGANDPKAKAVMEKVKKNWDDYKFVKPTEGLVLRYRTTISTNAGDLVVDFFEGAFPDVVRNFITRVKAQALDGQSISVEGDSLVFGAPLEKQAYTLPAQPLAVPLPKGAVFAQLVGDRAAGERFGISLKRLPGGGANVSMMGRIANPGMDTVLGQFVAQATKKPGSVVIKGAKIDVFEMPIFEGSQVRLPRLDKKGALDIPDLPMYTGVANPDSNPPESPKTRKAVPEAALNPNLDQATIPLKNPNVPPSKDDKRSPKSP